MAASQSRTGRVEARRSSGAKDWIPHEATLGKSSSVHSCSPTRATRSAAYSAPYFSQGHSLTAAVQGADPGPGQPVTADTLRSALAAAKRYRDM